MALLTSISTTLTSTMRLRRALAPPPSLIMSQQTRQYIFFPTSWVDFKERTKRWWLKAKPTTIRVELAMQRLRVSSRKARKLVLYRYREKAANLLTNYSSAKQRYRKFRKRRKLQRLSKLLNQFKAARSSSLSSLSSSLSASLPSLSSSAAPSLSKAKTKPDSKALQPSLSSSSSPLPVPLANRRIRWRERIRAYFKNRIQWAQAKYYRKVQLDEYTQPTWFDARTGRPLASRDSTGRFVNPWHSQSTNGIHSLSTIMTWRMARLFRNLKERSVLASLTPRLPWIADPKAHEQSKIKSLPLPSSTSDSEDSIHYTWIGHSTCWVQMECRSSPSNDWTILTDPIFSLRASPFQNMPIGVSRDVPPSHSIDQLAEHCRKLYENEDAKIDIACISHDHYDHMDENSILQLKDRVQLWVVPLGIKQWLDEKCGIQNVLELEWWQQAKLRKGPTIEVVSIESMNDAGSNDKTSKSTGRSNSVNDDQSDVFEIVDANGTANDDTAYNNCMTITCCPVQHWASRTMMDRNIRLWASFAFKDQSSFFFCGDTAYPQNEFPLFRQIGDALGGFDLAAIPIGAYEPDYMMKDSHVNPMEAVRIHRDIRAKQSVGIHWGTFALSEEGMSAPPKELQEHLKMKENFVTIQHGETLAVSCDAVVERAPTVPPMRLVGSSSPTPTNKQARMA